MKHRNLTITGTAIAMCLLILDSKTAFAGAAEGLDICIRTVIPSLFPFFVLSILLTGQLASIRGFRTLGKLFGVSEGCDGILLSGLLGGYPIGAQCAAESWRSGVISRETANRLLCFCSQPGPAFLFGMVALQFPEGKYAWVLWGIQLASTLLVARLLPPDRSRSIHPIEKATITLPQAVRSSIAAMANVCSWVVLFRVVIAFASRWFFWLLPTEAAVALTGFLELANGCTALSQIPDTDLRFLLSAVMLSFGGICVCMQTASAIDGLDFRCYLGGKIAQTLISGALACGFAGLYPPLIALAACFLLLYLRKTRKSSRNPQKLIV